jgi:hypothetical protein
MTAPSDKTQDTAQPRRWMKWIIAESAKPLPALPFARQNRPTRAKTSESGSAQSA